MSHETCGVEDGKDSNSSSRKEKLRGRNSCLGVEVAVDLRLDSGLQMVETVDKD
jgi:hypothetical protein